MNGTVVVALVLSGLCFLPPCVPRIYIYVRTLMTWAEAQIYCRSKYTDLAAVHSEQELAELNQLIGAEPNVWIGLRPDAESWRWSLENQDYYGEGEAGFRSWGPGRPFAEADCYKVCVLMMTSGDMHDVSCSLPFPFICYNAETPDPSSAFIVVNEDVTWADAQTYCRTNYTDLASVRNQAENDQMKMMLSQEAWIGLYRDSWKWSDGSDISFSNWDPGLAPTAQDTDTCVASNLGKWTNLNCNSKLYFACFLNNTAPAVRKQVVRVALKADSSVDVEQLKEGVLQKLNQRLKEQNLNEDVRLRWVERPDGKVLCKKEEERCTHN